MKNLSFQEAVDSITQKDTRYPPEAYFFVRDGLDYTVKHLNKPPRGLMRHISGKELSEGLCNYALEQYGPMARFTLDAWNLKRTEDFGEIVFTLVQAGKLGKTEEDKQEDFAGLFDLAEALSKPYAVDEALPVKRRGRT